MNTLTENMNAATAIMEDYKTREPQLRFRVETCVNKESVKLYVIDKKHVNHVITIDGGHVTHLENKSY